MKIKLIKTRTLAALMAAAAVGVGFLIWGAVPEKREAVEAPKIARPVKTVVIPPAGSGGERVFPGVQASEINLAFAYRPGDGLPAVRKLRRSALLARLDEDYEVQLANAESELGSAGAPTMRGRARKEEIAMLTARVAPPGHRW